MSSLTISGTSFLWHQMRNNSTSLELSPKQFEENLKNPNYTFPSGQIKVLGSLNFNNLDWLTSFPPGLCIEGNLVIKDCPLTSLPPDLLVGGMLRIENCPVTSLSQGLRVKGLLYIEGCHALHSLPPDLHAEADLTIRNCRAFTSLSTNTRVEGDLTIANCSFFTSLSAARVGRDLTIKDCLAFDSLPSSMDIGGSLRLEHCPLTSLPGWIMQLGLTSRGLVRTVDLEGIPLSDSCINTLDSFGNMPSTGLQFFFTPTVPTPTIAFASLDEALKYWEIASIPCPEFSRYELPHVLEFLKRLTETAEYKNPKSKEALKIRVAEALKLMKEDQEIKTRSYNIIYNGLISCDDRILSALDEIELMVNVYKLERSNAGEQELRELGKRYLLLEMVHQKAKEHLATLTWIDEIEIYLAFRIELADQFNLPLSTRNMIFREYAQVTKEQIQSKGEEIEKEYTEKKLETFLLTWSPWIRLQDRKTFPSYGQLNKLESNNNNQTYECCIGFCEAANPVSYEGRVYDYEAFKTSYLDNKTDPFTRRPVDLTQLYRLNDSVPLKKRKVEE